MQRSCAECAQDQPTYDRQPGQNGERQMAATSRHPSASLHDVACRLRRHASRASAAPTRVVPAPRPRGHGLPPTGGPPVPGAPTGRVPEPELTPAVLVVVAARVAGRRRIDGMLAAAVTLLALESGFVAEDELVPT